MALTTVFRVADWESPIRVNGNRTEGRFHRPGQITQYFTLHPLGAWAELVRREQPSVGRLAEFRHRLWAARVDLTNAVHIEWSSARRWGITPEALVDDEYAPCQALADRLRRRDATTVVVPNAAMPGTRTVVVFGARVAMAYTEEPIDDVDLPCALVAEDATVPPSVLPLVRHVGTAHAELAAWRRRGRFEFVEPVP